jgi:type IV pilus assembly protein PilA
VSSKYVAALSSDTNGQVTATIQNVATAVNGQPVSLAPLSTSTALATYSANSGSGLFGWRCGSASDGTTVNTKYLPGSCRG